MQIDNLTVTTPLIDVIVELRNQLNANGVQLLGKIMDSGEDVMICCPYHKDGQERRPSAGIRKSDGMFHCLACGETHSLPEVISYCFGHTDLDFGYKWLAKNFVTVEVSEREPVVLDWGGRYNADMPVANTTRIDDKELDTYRYVHPYMYERGLTDDIIEQFDIGYDKTTDSITFPVRDKNGDCMFVARRQVKTKVFNIPKGINKPLYGMYELSRVTPDKVYVCEGLFDCLRLWCNGKYAVAGFGCLFNNYQVKQLQDLPVRSIVLALDNDEAGIKATERLKKLVTNKLLYTVELPEGRKDVGECTDEEIQNLNETFY